MVPISLQRLQLPEKRSSRLRRRLKRLRWLRFTNNRKLIPNLFTLGNALFGFSSIVWAASGHFVAAAYFILLGAIMDALDGRIARLMRTTSDFGVQLDSLSDAISFCLAPAFLVYTWHLKHGGAIGFTMSALFLLAGVLRLARFNVTHLQQNINFIGLPTTLAGCFLSIVLLNTRTLLITPALTTAFIMLVTTLAVLMISSVPFPTFKHLPVPKYIAAPALLIFSVFAVAMGLTRILLALFVVYFSLAFIQLITRRK